MKPLPAALAVRWGIVMVIYALAKGFEIYDCSIFELTQKQLSGHSMKHIVAAFAALPVYLALIKLFKQ